METDTLTIVIMFSCAAAFAIGFFSIIYKIVGLAGRAKTSPDFQARKEQMNSIVTLTEDEKRTMNRGAVLGLVMATFICGIGFVSISVTYWKYVLQGEKTFALVTDRDSYISGSGDDKTTKYIYRLEAMVDGELVRDAYRSGSYHSAEVGETVEVYLSNEENPDIALAAVEERGPIWMFFVVGFYAAVIFMVSKYRKNIASGQMKLNMLPKSMQRKRLRAMGSGTEPGAPPIVEPVTSDGKPVYSIGGHEQKPPKANDGSDYRV